MMRQDSQLSDSATTPLPETLILSSHVKIHAASISLLDNYETYLDFAVFEPREEVVDADTLARRKLLRTPFAYGIFLLLWQASEFLSENVLREAGVQKISTEKNLNAHFLATNLAVYPTEVASLNSRIRKIGIAGASYDLIDRQALTSTNVLLTGTKSLHEFMIGLAEKNRLTINDLLSPAELQVETPASDNNDLGA